MKLKQILEEIKNNRISEGKSVGTLYHFTNMEFFIDIMKTNKLFGSEENSYEDNEENAKLFISFTRDKNFLKTNKRSIGVRFPYVRFTIDGNKLSYRYKFAPIQYNGVDGKNDPYIGDEQEERLLLPKNKLEVKDIDKYIEEVTFYSEIFNELTECKSLLRFLNKNNISKFDSFLENTNKEYEEIESFLQENMKILEDLFDVKIKLEKL